MTDNTSDLLGPRSDFGATLFEHATSAYEPAAVETTNGAPASEASPHEPATPTVRPVATLAVREVRGFPAGLLGKLPAPWVLHCALAPDGDRFVVTNSKAYYVEARDAGLPVFAGGEWFALAHAAQNDRAWSGQLRGWIERKRVGTFRLTHDGAFADMPVGNAVGLDWSCGEVLDRVDATLERVEVRT